MVTTGTGGDYTLRGSVGQQDASDAGSGGSYTLTGGFWNPDTGGPTVVTLARFVARSVGRDLTEPALSLPKGFGNLSGLGALVAMGAVGSALLLRRKRKP